MPTENFLWNSSGGGGGWRFRGWTVDVKNAHAKLWQKGSEHYKIAKKSWISAINFPVIMLGNAFPTAGILTFSRVSRGSLLNTPSTLQFFIRVSQLRRNQPVTRGLTSLHTLYIWVGLEKGSHRLMWLTLLANLFSWVTNILIGMMKIKNPATFPFATPSRSKVHFQWLTSKISR